MPYISPEQAERIHAFDQFVDSIDSLLKIPEVVQHLGAAAADLTVVRERSFLPMIRGNLVSIPLDRLDSDDIPVIAGAYGDGRPALFADSSMMWPTSSMREKVTARFLEHNRSELEAETFIQHAVDDTEYPHLISVPPDSAAIVRSGYEIHEPTKTRVTSRPLVLTDASLLSQPWLENALAGLHEYRHVVQKEDSADLPASFLAELYGFELEAYAGVASAAEGLQAAGYDIGKVGEAQFSLKVDAKRREYTTPDDPYAMVPQLLGEIIRMNLFAKEGLKPMQSEIQAILGGVAQ